MIVRFLRFIGFCIKYLFNPQPSDELAYVRSLLEDEIKQRRELENMIFVHLRVKPNIDYVPTERQRQYVASTTSPQVPIEPMRRGGIAEFRRSQAMAEKLRMTKEVDEDLKRKNPSYSPDELARDIADLDAELGTDTESSSIR